MYGSYTTSIYKLTLYNYLLAIADVRQANVQPTGCKKLEIATLKLPNVRDASCRVLLPSEDANTLYFVDPASNTLNRANLQNELAVDVIYHCESPSILCAALFIEFAPQQKALLLTERLPNAANKSMMTHSLSVALFIASQWTCNQPRVLLETATCKLDNRYSVSIGAVHTNKVLCGVYKASELEALAIDKAGTAQRLKPVPLGFAHFGFATGRSENTELLIISLIKWPELRLLQVMDGESLNLQLLRVIAVSASSLLWKTAAGLLFIASGNYKPEDSHEVNVFQVSDSGRRIESSGTLIAHSENLRISCWSTVGEKIAIYDNNIKNILMYSYELKNKVQT